MKDPHEAEQNGLAHISVIVKLSAGEGQVAPNMPSPKKKTEACPSRSLSHLRSNSCTWIGVCVVDFTLRSIDTEAKVHQTRQWRLRAFKSRLGIFSSSPEEFRGRWETGRKEVALLRLA
jgi:hypothetical protein